METLSSTLYQLNVPPVSDGKNRQMHLDELSSLSDVLYSGTVTVSVCGVHVCWCMYSTGRPAHVNDFLLHV